MLTPKLTRSHRTLPLAGLLRLKFHKSLSLRGRLAVACSGSLACAPLHNCLSSEVVQIQVGIFVAYHVAKATVTQKWLYLSQYGQESMTEQPSPALPFLGFRVIGLGYEE